jgi:hypothetical protein
VAYVFAAWSDTVVVGFIGALGLIAAALISFGGIAYGRRAEQTAEAGRDARERTKDEEQWNRQTEASGVAWERARADDHDKWRRERRADAYAALLAYCWGASNGRITDRSAADDLLGRIEVYGSTDAGIAARELLLATLEILRATQACTEPRFLKDEFFKFRTVARADLGHTD